MFLWEACVRRREHDGGDGRHGGLPGARGAAAAAARQVALRARRRLPRQRHVPVAATSRACTRLRPTYRRVQGRKQWREPFSCFCRNCLHEDVKAPFTCSTRRMFGGRAESGVKHSTGQNRVQKWVLQMGAIVIPNNYGPEHGVPGVPNLSTRVPKYNVPTIRT